MSSTTRCGESIASALAIKSRLIAAKPARFSSCVSSSVSNDCSRKSTRLLAPRSFLNRSAGTSDLERAVPRHSYLRNPPSGCTRTGAGGQHKVSFGVLKRKSGIRGIPPRAPGNLPKNSVPPLGEGTSRNLRSSTMCRASETHRFRSPDFGCCWRRSGRRLQVARARPGGRIVHSGEINLS